MEQLTITDKTKIYQLISTNLNLQEICSRFAIHKRKQAADIVKRLRSMRYSVQMEDRPRQDVIIAEVKGLPREAVEEIVDRLTL